MKYEIFAENFEDFLIFSQNSSKYIGKIKNALTGVQWHGPDASEVLKLYLCI